MINTKQNHTEILQEIHPIFQKKIVELIDNRPNKEMELKALYALVSYEKQEQLWLIGRNDQGEPLYDSLTCKPLTVTSAKGGQSWHNFGLAIDLAYFRNNEIINCDENKAAYDDLGKVAKKLGITWGGTFTPYYDATHFQWTAHFTEIQKLDLLMKKGGLNLVWEEINNNYK